MRKYELSLSKDYVPDWTVVDAVREIFQNALDQQTTTPDNKMFFNYNADESTLYIGNKSSVLNVSTLLLGSSTKQNDPDTIGQFGEGYKIATLVLTRLNKRVVFYNYGAKEVWRPRFVNSRRYGTEILTFFVDKKYIWQTVPDNNLTIAIEGITQDEHRDIIESNLHLQDVGETQETEFGRILYEEDYKGMVFVNGLFVCNHRAYDYGYDFKPKYINLDRDRKLANTFDLEWLSSKMWSGVSEERAVDLIKKGAADTNFMASSYKSSDKFKELASLVHDEFKREYGEDAVPVTSQAEYELINKRHTPIFVNDTYSNMIKISPSYSEPKIKRITNKERLESWLKNHRQVLTKRAIKKLQDIIDDIKE